MRRNILSLCFIILCLVIVAVSVGTTTTTYVPEFWVDTGDTAQLSLNITQSGDDDLNDSLYYIETPVIITVTNPSKNNEPVENATLTITGHNTYEELTTNSSGIAEPNYTFDYTEITRGGQQIAVTAIKPGYAYVTEIIYVDYRGILEISVRTDSITLSDLSLLWPDTADADIEYTIIVTDSSTASKDPVEGVNVTMSHDANTDYVSLDCTGCEINFQAADTDENGEVPFSVHTTQTGELEGAVFTATAEKEGYLSDSTTFTAPVTVEGCFIATAAYGSPIDEHLDFLRAFRDTLLLTNPVGKFIVGTYYTTSPPIANAVAQSDNLRAATRMFLLTPLIYLSAICLNTTAFAAFVVLIFIILFVLRRHVKVLLKGIGCGALTIAAFTVTIFTLGALGYELPICATVAAYLLPLIIPAAVAVCILVWIESRSRPRALPYSF